MGRPSDETIAVCIVSRNEAAVLPDCLASAAWADEVLVLDLESTDASAQIARDAGARVVSRAPHPVVEPLRDEIAAHATSAWVLALDPDERVRPGLAEALRAAAGRADKDAVVLPRMNIDFGWPPEAPAQRYEPQLRMYRRSAVRWPHVPNQLPVVPEDRVVRLPAQDDLVLEHHRNLSVAAAAERLVRYPTAQAQSMLDAGQVFTAQAMLAALGDKARRYYVENRAWEEGVPGLVRATVLLNHHVHVWTAFWVLSGAQRTPEDDAVALRLGRVLRAVAAVADAPRLPRRAAGRLVRSLRARAGRP